MASTMNEETEDPSTQLHELLFSQFADTEALLDRWKREHEGDVTSPVTKKRKSTTAALSLMAEPTVVTPEVAAKEESFPHIPTVDMVGVSPYIVQLCATVSGQIYQDKNISKREEFQAILDRQIPKSDPSASVLLFVEPFLNPTITFVRAGTTLIIGWRGTQKLQDVLTDFQIDTFAPWEEEYPHLEVPKAHYDMVVTYFQRRGRDLTNMILGTFVVPNSTVDITAPIQDIVLTGHSLGGGIAQIAHFYLKLLQPQKRSPLYGLAEALQTVTVRTLAFSAPMTTALSIATLSKPEELAQRSKTTDFLNNTMAPVMRNIVYSTDVVPRGYANLQFIDAFLRAFLTDATSNGAISSFVDTFIRFHRFIFKSRKELMKQAEQYFHVAKLIYYEDPNSSPVVYVDGGFANQGPMICDAVTEKSFYDLTYTPPSGNVATGAFAIHMEVVTGPGLAFA